MPDAYSRAATAYGNAGRATVDQRELEANALLKAAHAFEDIRRGWGPGSEAELDAALHYNRKLWTIFAAEAANAENPLPLEIRNNIANISIFVFKRTMELLAAPSAKKIEALIGINKALAAGLLGSLHRSPAAGSDAAPATPTARAV